MVKRAMKLCLDLQIYFNAHFEIKNPMMMMMMIKIV